MTDLFIDTASLSPYQKLWVGFSGGLDSTVLLHRLSAEPTLIQRLSVIHVHHGLSPHADAWLAHCQAFCAALSVPFFSRRITLKTRSNLEESARLARLDVFKSFMGDHDAMVLAHHLDDQAETLLLQLCRGAGVDGLAAMLAVKPFASGYLVRPFLQMSRKTLEAYAHHHQLHWIEDESNKAAMFSRNYIRHQVMPLLKARWPNVASNIARSATHCQQTVQNLKALAEMDADLHRGSTLCLSTISTLNEARVVNVLRSWLKANQVTLPSTSTFARLLSEAVFARADAMPCIEWGGVCVRRYQQTLYLLPSPGLTHSQDVDWVSYPNPLKGEGMTLYASPVETGLIVPKGSRVRVKTRLGGELFHWHGQTKSLKKLFQQWQVPPWMRDTIPLIYLEDELVAVVGFAVSDKHVGSDAHDAYHLSFGEP